MDDLTREELELHELVSVLAKAPESIVALGQHHIGFADGVISAYRYLANSNDWDCEKAAGWLAKAIREGRLRP